MNAFNNYTKLETSQLQQMLQTTMEYIKTSFKCEVCNGGGHYPNDCGTLKRINKAVAFLPGVREVWREEKRLRVERMREQTEQVRHVRNQRLSRKVLGLKRRRAELESQITEAETAIDDM